jgi:hypothetical protein
MKRMLALAATIGCVVAAAAIGQTPSTGTATGAAPNVATSSGTPTAKATSTVSNLPGDGAVKGGNGGNAARAGDSAAPFRPQQKLKTNPVPPPSK